jgi:hypothetical protein
MKPEDCPIGKTCPIGKACEIKKLFSTVTKSTGGDYTCPESCEIVKLNKSVEEQDET